MISTIVSNFNKDGYELPQMLEGLALTYKVSEQIALEDLLYYLKLAYEYGYDQGCFEATGGQ